MAETKLETRNSKLGGEAPRKPGQVRDFTDLQTWKLARELRISIYAATKKFPPEERYVLFGQLRRAASSITANIAEGFGRYSYRENMQFCRQARGSAFELRDHLTTALDEKYILRGEWERLDALAQRVIQLLNGYIPATQKRAAQVTARPEV